MADIISIHSFRGGTGKSNITANLATLFALQGKRIAVIDTDIQSPGIHAIFGFEDTSAFKFSLNDYLWGNCTIEEATYDVTSNVSSDIAGEIFLIPSSIKPNEIARVLKEGYDVRRLSQGIKDIIQLKDLDVLLIDTHPGLNEETLLSFALSSVVAIILRPDRQDYQGTGVTLKVASRLKVGHMFLIVNKTPPNLDFESLRSNIEGTFECPVAAVLPHSDEMMMLASEGVFSVKYPHHEFTSSLRNVVENIMNRAK